MNNFNKIKEIIQSLDPGEPVQVIKISNKNNIRVIEKSWTPGLTGDSLHEKLVNSYATRKIRIIDGQASYVVDTDTIISNIKAFMGSEIVEVFRLVYPGSNAKRSNLYKSIFDISRKIKNSDNDSAALNFSFDVLQYYYSVTKELSIKDTANDVHRKNIYQLFNILEQKHGSKANSN